MPDPDPPAGVACWAIVVAAGTGRRFGQAKQYAALGGRRVVDWAVEAARVTCGSVVLVVPAGEEDQAGDGAELVVGGGPTRSASVRAGLAAVPADAEVVVVHDGARPLARPALFEAVVAAVAAGADAAVPAVPVVDTLRRRSGGTVDRADLVAVQTPQAFRAQKLRAAHASGPDATDDASLVEAAGGTVVVVEGDRANTKITVPADLATAEMVLTGRASPVRP